MAGSSTRIAVVIEAGRTRTFASAIDWPGWSRSARTTEAALDALAAYARRYEFVAATGGLRLPRVPDAAAFAVIEELPGDATTDFGAPGRTAAVETRPATAAVVARVAALLNACWTVLDTVAASAPAELRKGPRGGGRDRDAMVDHVLGAEHAFAGKIGVRIAQPSRADAPAVRAVRDAVLAVVTADRSGEPSRPGGWAPRYAARRIAWHALDHAWEMEDRSTSG